MISKMAFQNNLKVVLNGLGGDELFGGYDVFSKIELWNKLKKNKHFINLIPNIHPKISKAHEIANLNSLGQLYSHYYSTYRDSDLGSLFKGNNYSTQHTISNLYNKNNIPFTDTFEAMSFYNLKSYIGNHQTRMVDQFTMNFSLEGRLPFLDHNFIATSFKIPTKYKVKNEVQKYILKEVAKKHIAPSCITMNKKGLRLPLEHWISNDLKNIVEESIQKLKNRFIFDNNEIDNILKLNNKQMVWQLVSTELWLERFIN